MPYPKYNKKSEVDPREERADPKYPWVGGTVDIGGKEEINYYDPDKPGESFSHTLHYSGAYNTQEKADDDKNGLNNVLNHEVRNYTSGGSSSTSDGHSDEANLEAKGSKRRNFAGDDGTSTAGDRYSGAGGSTIGGDSQGAYSDSNGDTYVNTVGNHIKNHDGDYSEHYEGDHTTSVNKNLHVMVGSGEYGIHVQQGNMDIKVDAGKHKTESSAEMILKSTTSITLICGSSQIIIEPSKITIKASAVEFIKA